MPMGIGIGISPVLCGGVWSPLNLGSDLIAWHDNAGDNNFTFNGPTALAVEEYFSAGDLADWTRTTSGTVTSTLGQAVAGVASKNHKEQFTFSGETWAQWDMTVDSGLSLPSNNDRFIGTGVSSFNGNIVASVGVQNQSGVNELFATYVTNSGLARANISSPAFVEGQKYNIQVHWVKGAGTGVLQVWIDGELSVDLSNITSDTTSGDSFTIGNMATVGTISGTINIDNVKVGPSGTATDIASDLVFENFTTDPGWSVVGDGATVSGGEIATVIPSNTGAHGERVTFASQTEVWAEYDFKVDAGSLSELTNTQDIQGAGLTATNSARLVLGIVNTSGTLQFRVVYKKDSGLAGVAISSPAFTLGQTYKIQLHYKQDTDGGTDTTNTGIAQVWIDNELVLDLSNVDSDTVTITDFFAGNVSNNFSATGTIRIDNVRVGTSGSDPAIISRWEGISGNNNHINQSVAADQPRFANSEVVLDGVSEYLQSSAFSSALTQPITVFLVATKTASGNTVIFDGIVGTSEISFKVSNGNWALFSGTVVREGSTEDTSKHIFICEFNDPTGTKLYIDGGTADIDAATSGSETMTGLTLGADNAGANFSALKVYDGAVINKLLTTAEKNQYGNYLKAKHSGTSWTDI